MTEAVILTKMLDVVDAAHADLLVRTHDACLSPPGGHTASATLDKEDSTAPASPDPARKGGNGR